MKIGVNVRIVRVSACAGRDFKGLRLGGGNMSPHTTQDTSKTVHAAAGPYSSKSIIVNSRIKMNVFIPIQPTFNKD